MNETILKMDGVFKHVQGKYALQGLDFMVASGQVLGLLGRNGAGKTTLIESALGLRNIDLGNVALFGESPASLSDAARNRLGYVPQQTDLFEWMTATQMLAFFKAFYARWDDAKVIALLDRWCIPTNVRIGKLSGGEKQRLAIIRAIAHDPEFLILDEPVSSLDPAGRREFLHELVDRAIARETTILFSTHILSDIERVAMNVAFMRDGKIVMQAPLDEISEDTRRIIGPAHVLENAAWSNEISRTNDAKGYQNSMVRLTKTELGKMCELEKNGVRVERVTLEDLFIEITK